MNARRLSLILGIAFAVGCSKNSSTATSPAAGGGGGPTLNVAADSIRMLTNSNCTVHATATDPGGNQLSFAYAAMGGTVASGGPTSTSAIFTPTRIGNDSVVVTVNNGHGGHSNATVLVYAVDRFPPGHSQSLGCAFRFTPAESLFVVDCSVCEALDVGCQPTGVSTFPSGVLSPSQTFAFWPTDDPGQTCKDFLSSWDITVRRPLPDGRSYHFAGLR